MTSLRDAVVSRVYLYTPKGKVVLEPPWGHPLYGGSPATVWFVANWAAVEAHKLGYDVLSEDVMVGVVLARGHIDHPDRSDEPMIAWEMEVAINYKKGGS